MIALAAAAWLAAAAAPGLPAEGCVRLLREARIEAAAGRKDEAQALVRRALEEYPSEGLPAVVYVQLMRDASPEAAAAARKALAERLARPDATLPVTAIRFLTDDPRITTDEMKILGDAVRAARTRTPDDPKLLETAYRLAARQEDKAEALSIVDAQLALKETRELLSRRFILLRGLGRWDDAVAAGRRLVAVSPKDVFARLEIASCLARAGKLDDAKAELTALLPEKVPFAASTLVSLGWSFRDAGRDADARWCFEKALALDPENTTAKDAIRLALATPQERLAAGATSDSRWAGETDALKLFNEGSKRLAAGDAASAYDLLQRAVAADTHIDDVWHYNLAMAAIRLQKWPQAEGALRTAIQANPDRPLAHLQLGRVLEAQGKCASALEPLKRSLALRSDLVEAHFYLYKCHTALGDEAAAQQELKTYQSLKGTKP